MLVLLLAVIVVAWLMVTALVVALCRSAQVGDVAQQAARMERSAAPAAVAA